MLDSWAGVLPSRNWLAAASDAASVARLRWPMLLKRIPASTVRPIKAARPTKASAISTNAWPPSEFERSWRLRSRFDIGIWHDGVGIEHNRIGNEGGDPWQSEDHVVLVVDFHDDETGSRDREAA